MMNRYGEMAQNHMKTWLPRRYAELPEPDRYFEQLGEEIGAQIEELEATVRAVEPPGETWLERVGRFQRARSQAEEVVLADLVYLPPEDDPIDPPTQLAAAEAT